MAKGQNVNKKARSLGLLSSFLRDFGVHPRGLILFPCVSLLAEPSGWWDPCTALLFTFVFFFPAASSGCEQSGHDLNFELRKFQIPFALLKAAAVRREAESGTRVC